MVVRCSHDGEIDHGDTESTEKHDNVTKIKGRSVLRDLRASVVNNEFMENEEPQPLTDSPWFWVLAFSLMALLALVAIGGKYGRRQTRLELQYQARERIAERRAAANNLPADARIDDHTSRRRFASPRDNLIPLWPLAVVLFLVAIFSAIMLGRQSTAAARRCPRPGSPGDDAGSS
jgi:hypothetical protein